MRAASIAFVMVLCSCAAPTLKDYEDRLDRGRARLAALAKAEFEAHPEDEELLIIYGCLAGEESTSLIERLDPDVGPLGSIILAKAVLAGLWGQPWTPPTADEASEVLELLDQTLPDSSLAPLYRLHWLKISTNGGREFWNECRVILELALERDHWESPVPKFFVRWYEWLEAHDSDDYVKASFDPRVGDAHAGNLMWLARLIDAALFSPSLPDPTILEVAHLLQQVADRLVRTSPQVVDFLIGSIVSKVVLPARFLGLWRRGDFAAAEAVAAAVDREIEVERHWKSYKVEWMAASEAKTFVFTSAMTRMFDGMLAGIKERKIDIDDSAIDLKAAVSNEALQLEGHRRMAEGAREWLDHARKECLAKEPFVQRVLRRPAAPPGETNALRWALRDRGVIQGDPFPQALLHEAFNREWEPDMEYVGIHQYHWLLKEALVKTESLPTAELKSFQARGHNRLDLAAILMQRGETPDESASLEEIGEVRDYAMSHFMKGYCQILAIRAVQDRKAAAAMLPAGLEKDRSPDWFMIGETLRHVCGQDFGYDLAAWKAWLLNEEK